MKQNSTDRARAQDAAGNEPQRKRAEDLKKPEVLEARDPSHHSGKLKRLGGSSSDDWNNRIANEAINTLWMKNSDEETRHRQMTAAIDGLIGINPHDELEGMMAAQLIASHSAAMECYRRAMIGEQSFEGRRENLNQANKLSRSFATLLDALNRHRGKGQQKVTVEHVHVHSGGQAIVGAVAPGGGTASKDEEQAHAKQLTYAPEPPLRSADAAREPVSISSDGERPLPDARGPLTGRTEG
jgi:hypothetical protein